MRRRIELLIPDVSDAPTVGQCLGASAFAATRCGTLSGKDDINSRAARRASGDFDTRAMARRYFTRAFDSLANGVIDEIADELAQQSRFAARRGPLSAPS
jgi:hypothetical protein